MNKKELEKQIEKILEDTKYFEAMYDFCGYYEEDLKNGLLELIEETIQEERKEIARKIRDDLLWKKPTYSIAVMASLEAYFETLSELK